MVPVRANPDFDDSFPNRFQMQTMNALKIAAVVFLAIATVAGCATSTIYQPASSDGGNGFSSTQLGENAFEVRFRGDSSTSPEKASDFALLRAAELTLEKGFDYFIIDDDENSQQTSVRTTPARSETKRTWKGATTTYYGGNTYTTSKPRARKVIVCFKEKPDWSGLIYDARFVVQSVKEKYETEFDDARAESTE